MKLRQFCWTAITSDIKLTRKSDILQCTLKKKLKLSNRTGQGKPKRNKYDWVVTVKTLATYVFAVHREDKHNQAIYDFIHVYIDGNVM